MSQRTKNHPDADDIFSSNVVTLREFVERVVHYIGRIEEERWVAHAKEHGLIAGALDKQEEVQSVRNAAQNEWRAAMNDLVARFPTRDSVDGHFNNLVAIREAMNKRIGDLEAANIRASTLVEERTRQTVRNQWLIGIVITVANITIGVLLRFVK